MKTILFCDNTLWGLVNFRGRVIEHFRDNGYRVVLCAPEKEDKQMRTTLPDGVGFEPIRMGRNSKNPINDLRYMFRLYKIFRRVRPDYVFTYTIKPNIYGSLVASWLKIPLTCMMAGMGYVFNNDGLASRVARRLYRIGLSHAQNVLLLNNDNRARVVEMGMCDPNKIILLQGGEGLDLQTFHYFDNESSDVLFLFVGRLSWDKGYGEFVEAAKKVSVMNPEVTFNIYGSLDPSYPNNVSEDIVKSDTDAGIYEYKGFVPDMNEIYRRKGIVMVLPSYHEGMSRSLMEACAVGKPIITTNIAGCREFVDDGINGYLVPVKDSQALADAMMKYLALADDEKKKFSLASRKHAEKYFDVNDVIRIYDEIVHDAIK
ncbi:MAG: glycosyltransferase family 4 protein [Prevotella sp.]|nr:glycosyltransferase family 4 protein [Prevotella sp.]